MNKILKNLSKNITTVITITTIILMSAASVNATTIINSNSPSLIEAGEVNKATVKNELYTNGNSIIQGGGTLTKAENYVDSKLGDVVGFFQSIIKPFTYIMFIISAITILVGVVTGSKQRFIGFLGMAFSVLVYVVVIYAPQIVDYLSAWLSV